MQSNAAMHALCDEAIECSMEDEVECKQSLSRDQNFIGQLCRHNSLASDVLIMINKNLKIHDKQLKIVNKMTKRNYKNNKIIYCLYCDKSN